MAEFPAMPLWTDAYLADTGHLSYEEHGYYLMILMHMWRNPGCRFPADDEWLRRKFRLCEADFNKTLKPLLKEFCQCDGNWWTQKKLQKVWKQVQESCLKQSGRAKLRWEKEKSASRGNAAPAVQPKPKPKPKHKESTETPGGVDQPDLDALFYQRGKALLGQKAGGVLTNLRKAVGLGAALEVIDQARNKDSPAEYVAGVIRAKGNGHAKPTDKGRGNYIDRLANKHFRNAEHSDPSPDPPEFEGWPEDRG